MRRGRARSLGPGHVGTAHGKFSRDKDTCSGAGVPEGAPSLLRWRQCNQLVHLCHSCPQHVLSHSTVALHRHGIWLDHVTPIPPHTRVSPSGTDVTVSSGPTGLIPDQTRYTPALGVQEHRLTQDVSWEAQSQQQPGTMSPLCPETSGAWDPALYLSTLWNPTHTQHLPRQSDTHVLESVGGDREEVLLAGHQCG